VLATTHDMIYCAGIYHTVISQLSLPHNIKKTRKCSSYSRIAMCSIALCSNSLTLSRPPIGFIACTISHSIEFTHSLAFACTRQNSLALALFSLVHLLAHTLSNSLELTLACPPVGSHSLSQTHSPSAAKTFSFYLLPSCCSLNE